MILDDGRRVYEFFPWEREQPAASTYLYTDDSILKTDMDVERHRDALGRIAEIGATWVSFAWDFSTQAETLDFVDGFAASHLGADRV